jgi:hypothetical protein
LNGEGHAHADPDARSPPPSDSSEPSNADLRAPGHAGPAPFDDSTPEPWVVDLFLFLLAWWDQLMPLSSRLPTDEELDRWQGFPAE